MTLKGEQFFRCSLDNYTTFDPLFVTKRSLPISLFGICFCVASVPGFQMLYKQSPAHRETWLLQRQRRRKKAWCSSGQIICYSTHFCFLGVLCWRLWCWLYVSWPLGFSPWTTRPMGWSYVAASSSGPSFLPVEVLDGEDHSWAQVRGLNLNPPYHCPC